MYSHRSYSRTQIPSQPKHRSLHSLILILCSTLLLVSCGGGSGNDNGSASLDPSQACGFIGLNTKIINGQTCESPEKSAIVRFAALLDTGAGEAIAPICTGTMIDSTTVLTAAHCIVSKLSGMQVTGFGIYVGTPPSGTFYQAGRYSIAPGFRYDPSVDRHFNDAAVVKLNRSPSLSTLPVLLSQDAESGTTGLVYGYGKRLPGDTEGEGEDFLLLQAGGMEIANVTPNHIFVSFGGDGANVCNGDSGGPLLVEAQSAPAIAGVVSEGTTEGCVAGDITTFTNLRSPGLPEWLLSVVPDLQSR